MNLPPSSAKIVGSTPMNSPKKGQSQSLDHFTERKFRNLILLLSSGKSHHVRLNFSTFSHISLQSYMLSIDVSRSTTVPSPTNNTRKYSIVKRFLILRTLYITNPHQNIINNKRTETIYWNKFSLVRDLLHNLSSCKALSPEICCYIDPKLRSDKDKPHACKPFYMRRSVCIRVCMVSCLADSERWLTTNGLPGVIFQKTEIFITNSFWTSDPTYYWLLFIFTSTRCKQQSRKATSGTTRHLVFTSKNRLHAGLFNFQPFYHKGYILTWTAKKVLRAAFDGIFYCCIRLCSY
jgi:hypothetical protein